MECIMRADHLSFTYEDSKEGIRDIDFKIDEGEVVLLTGDSGCGKSTLLKCLNGLIPAVTEGEVRGSLYMEGSDYWDLKMFDLNREIGSVFQNPRTQFFTDHTTSELVFPMENYGFSRKEMDGRVEKLKKAFHLDHILNRRIYTLSSGERQMLALACARTLGQKVLLFDEPSANLDYGNAMGLGRLIAKMKKKGITVIVADHRFYYLDGIIDKALFMKDGKLEVFHSEEEFKNSGYNTRSFDIFSIEKEFRQKKNYGPCLAALEQVSCKDILRDVSLKLHKGEVTVLVGSNGAGKTTMAKLLCQSIKPDRGSVSMTDLPFFIMQDPDYQLFGTSVANELALVKNDKEAIRKCLEYLNLYEYRHAHPFALSGGQKQRLQIGMALLCDKDVMIFDEPTSGLDVSSMERISGEVCRLGEEAAILVISHDYEFIRNVADRIVYLKDGCIRENFLLNRDTVTKLNEIFRDMEEGGKNEEIEN